MQERLLACLECYVQESVRSNCEGFLEQFCKPRAVMRQWDLRTMPDRSGQPISSAADSPLDRLTRRERQIVDLVAQGKSNAEIAAVLGIRPNTVKGHLQSIFGKLGAASRTEVALIALRGRD